MTQNLFRLKKHKEKKFFFRFEKHIIFLSKTQRQQGIYRNTIMELKDNNDKDKGNKGNVWI